MLLICCAVGGILAYDPADESLKEILPAENTFEPFYPRDETSANSARAPHAHGSFYSHRNPALVEVTT